MSTREESNRRYRAEEERRQRKREAYQRFRARQRGEDVPLQTRTRSTAICSVDGCDRQVKARGWCHRCYYRWQRTGDPTLVLTRPTGLDPDGALRWTGWTVTEFGCWEWNGPRDRAGYGKIKYRGLKQMAHRFAYESWVGPIPPGLIVRHRRCHNPPCINPAHLEIGTQVDNMRDMYEAERNNNARGEKCGSAKLTEPEVVRIRELRSQGWLFRQLAEAFGVSETLVRMVVKRRAWKHVA